jgi:predicted membrane-bound mannosyltransferase
MNHELWKTAGARVLAMAFLLAGAAACGERISNTSSGTPKPMAASPSAVVIGQAPAEPTPASSDTAQVTAPAGAQSDVGKVAESVSRPIEGDNHSYSTVAPTTPQKADGVNRTGSDDSRSTK